jgi:superfamily II DNA or RNA helicase
MTNETFYWSDPINIRKSQADSRTLIMPHQDDAVKALNQYYDLSGKTLGEQNGVVVMPTGSGKTYTAVHWLLRSGLANGYRILWLAHRQELIDQTNREFRNQAPILADTGIKKITVLPISGMHLKMNMASRANIYICSIASVANKYGYRFIRRMLGEEGKRKLIVVIDEAHHGVSAQYQKVLKRVTELNPNRILLGLTATPVRMQEREWKHLFRMFDVEANLMKQKGTKKGYIYEITLNQLIISGFLAKPIREKVNTELIGEIEYHFTAEDDAYFARFGDLSEKFMDQIARSSARNKVIVEQYMNNRKRYGKTLIFAVNQMHAKTLYDELKAQGVSCEYVVSSKAGAQETIQNFKNNEYEVLINVQILTEGSDIPDVQTVFLTRETNSDSLLMQMMGRGLRGVKAGGTKNAYIVDFHDTWEKYTFWLDPGKLHIFYDGENEMVDIEKIPHEVSHAVEEKTSFEIPPMLKQEPALTMQDIYQKLYEKMKATWNSSTENPILPCGWYSVVDEFGAEKKILVYEDQLYGYQKLRGDLNLLLEESATPANVTEEYFADGVTKPMESELSNLLDFIFDTSSMPPYFSLDEREFIEPDRIAKNLIASGLIKDEDKEYWLKKLYDNSPIIREIYRTFYAFKITVLNANKPTKSSVVCTDDERLHYHLIDDYHPLHSLYQEVLSEYPELTGHQVIRIEWSRRVYKSWFGLCVQNVDMNQFVIYINKLLSSPDVDKEVIKYLIYHELLHANGYWAHDARFREKEWSYPNSDELDGFLDELCLRYNLDVLHRERNNSEKNISTAVDTEPSQVKNLHAKGIVEGFKYCRECGNKLPNQAKFCDRCGSDSSY